MISSASQQITWGSLSETFLTELGQVTPYGVPRLDHYWLR